MKSILLTFFLAACCNLIYGQKEGRKDYAKKVVVSKSDYTIEPEPNMPALAVRTWFERYDSLGRKIEEKRGSGGRAWSFMQYDRNGNEIEKRILNDDSSFADIKITSYDKLSREVLTTYTASTGKTTRIKQDCYADSIVTVEWNGDKAPAVTNIKYLNKQGKILREVFYKEGQMDSEFLSEYKDTVLQKKLSFFYDEGVFAWGEESIYENGEHRMKKALIASNKRRFLHSEYEFDSNWNQSISISYMNERVYQASHWKNQYDSLNRPVCIEEYIDTREFQPVNVLTQKIIYEYGDHIEVMKTIDYDDTGNENGLSVSTYDSDGRWLNTTETVNGILKKYHYVVYEYKE